MPKILVVDDDVAFCNMLKGYLERQKYTVFHAFGVQQALQIMDENILDVLLTDLRLPNGTGIELLDKIRAKGLKTQVVVMTGYAEVSSAVAAMKKGAADYIAKPFSPDALLETLQKLQSVAPNTGPATETKPKQDLSNRVMGVSDAAVQLNNHIALVAPTNMSVFINGASGTGKEVTAKAIHDLSKRCTSSFIAVDCGAIPKELAASEFFGHVKGSFTGAVEDKVGCFEASSGGTLFLDEVGNLSYENQVQLLRALQERSIKKVGSTKETPVDIRLVSATNENLEQAVAFGRFREDLFHRLNEFTINVPSLKERNLDLPLFIDYFLNKANAELHKDVKGFTNDALSILKKYPWPGNFRELQNLIKRLVLLCQEEEIDVALIPEHMKNKANSNVESSVENAAVNWVDKEVLEKRRIEEALVQTKYNKSKAAKLLQITRKTLYNRMAYYKLDL